MSARVDKSYRGSVPNVQRAAAVHETKQANLDARVAKQRKGSTATALAKFVKRAIR